MKLELHPIRPEDAEAYHAGEDAEIVRWLSGGHAPVEGVREYFSSLQDNASRNEGKRAFGIWVDGQLAGYIEFDPAVDDGLSSGDVNVAYCVFPWARGRGVAGQALQILAARLMKEGLGRAALRIERHNHASTRVAVKAGFVAGQEFVSATDRQPDGSPATLQAYRSPTGLSL